MKRWTAIVAAGLIVCSLPAFAVAPVDVPKAPAAPATSSPAGKYDTKLPIEISSDSLEVLQHEDKAIFRGNVIAVQGQVRLKSDTMTVHYKQKSDADKTKPAPKPEPKPGDAQSSAMGAISRIDVDGNVFVATPEESAKGDKGNYDVDSKTIHLFGDNVTLTRDKNILRGTALEYNLATGRSVLTNNGTAVNGATSSAGGRVRGVFVPNQEPQKPGQEKNVVPQKKSDQVPPMSQPAQIQK